MGTFNNYKNSDKHRNFGSYRGKGDNREHREMYSAVCADCGNKCEVPFQPTGNKPVYCSDCFSKQNNSERYSNNSHNNKQHRDYSRENNKQSYKYDKNNYHTENLKMQFEKINYKLDKILKILSQKEMESEESKDKARNLKERKIYKKEVDSVELKKVLKETLKTDNSKKKTSTKSKTIVKKKTTKKKATRKTPQKKTK